MKRIDDLLENTALFNDINLQQIASYHSPEDLADALALLHNTSLFTQENLEALQQLPHPEISLFVESINALKQVNLLTQANFNQIIHSPHIWDIASILDDLKNLDYLTQITLNKVINHSAINILKHTLYAVQEFKKTLAPQTSEKIVEQLLKIALDSSFQYKENPIIAKINSLLYKGKIFSTHDDNEAADIEQSLKNNNWSSI